MGVFGHVLKQWLTQDSPRTQPDSAGLTRTHPDSARTHPDSPRTHPDSPGLARTQPQKWFCHYLELFSPSLELFWPVLTLNHSGIIFFSVNLILHKYWDIIPIYNLTLCWNQTGKQRNFCLINPWLDLACNQITTTFTLFSGGISPLNIWKTAVIKIKTS